MVIRVGLLGCGKVGRIHAQGYKLAADLAEVVVCCDEWKAEQAEETAQSLGSATAVTRWRDVIERADVDAVDICMPHYLHAPITIAAARAGKHVLVEKPMAMNLAEARTMVAAAEQVGTVLMVVQNQRFMSAHQEIKKLLDQGVIGRVIAVRVDCNQFLKQMYPPGNWIFSKEKAGGGMVISTAVHKLDLLRYFLGEIRRVSSFHATTGLNPGMDSEDIAAFLLEFESGIVGEGFYVFAAHKVPIPTSTGELTILYGERGMIHNVLGWHIYSTEVEKYSGGLTRVEFPPEPYGHSITTTIRHYLECIQTGAEPLTSGRDNLGTMAVIDAIYRSAARASEVVEVEK